MQKNEKMIPLSEILSPSDGNGANRNYINIIQDEEIPVLCIKKGLNKKRLMPFKTLFDNNEKFWQQNSNWEYFLNGNNFNKLMEKAKVRINAWDLERQKTAEKPVEKMEIKQEEELEELEADEGYGHEYKNYIQMSPAERIECLNRSKNILNELVLQKKKDPEIVTEALVDTAKSAALINHAALEDAMHLADDEAKKFTQDFVDSTREMVKSSTQLFSDDVFNDSLMNTLVNKSNGTIVQHMTRVYLNGIAFLSYYNNLVTTTSAIQRLRLSFASKYRKFYQALLPHINIDDIILERVFYGGMRAVPPELFYKWAVGFLIHDIGKASAIEYHEGESAYDRNKVVEHVKTGYQSVVSKTNYPMEASLITGYHHEYYGDPDGYGYFRAYLQQYKKHNPDAKQDYCITYDLEPILDYQTLAYFPAKVLEIIDVYDSVTDPNRVYRKPMEPHDALTMMREQFIEKNHKIDVILFDIFNSFIREKQLSKAEKK